MLKLPSLLKFFELLASIAPVRLRLPVLHQSFELVGMGCFGLLVCLLQDVVIPYKRYDE